jgi:pyruvate formate lyase activating enzyme
MICPICPHACDIPTGGVGFCKGRGNVNGEIISLAYGYISSSSLDPIEKKPLYHFFPRSKIFSVGSFGCNFRCAFCQNHEISMVSPNDGQYITPVQIAALAQKYERDGNIGVAYTYNEPLINFEFILDCAVMVREAGLKNVLVTNGYIKPDMLKTILPYIDAFNIDLKGFTDEFYAKVSGGLDVVKKNIIQAAAASHAEVTTLIIPGENDSDNEIKAIAQFLAGVNDEIPWHLSRFLPRYKMTDKPPTLLSTMYRLHEIAKGYLKYVYLGNM